MTEKTSNRSESQ